MSSNSDASAAVYRRLLGYLKPHLGVFVLAILANIAYAGIESWFIQAMAPLVDEALFAKNQSMLAMAPFIFVAAVLARSVFGFISLYGLDWVGRQVVKALRQELFAQYLRLPASFFDRQPAGFLLSKMTFNTERLAGSVTNGITQVVRDGATVIFVLFYLFYINWQLASIFLITGPLIGVVAQMATKRFKRTGKKIQAAMGGVAQVTSEAVSAYKVIRSYGGENRELKRFEAINEENRSLFMKFVLTKAVSVPLVQLIAAIGIAFVIYYSSILIQQGDLTPGEFVAMMGLMFYLLKPLKQLTTVNSVIQEGIAAVGDIFALIDAPKETDDGQRVLGQAKGKIAFSEVSFQYDSTNQRALKAINLLVEPGQTVALVGRSGSGKSTLTALLMRFYQGYSGHIKIDDQDISELTLRSLRQSIAEVSQSVVLFNDTIRNNIAYAQTDVSDEAIEAAARSAYAWDFITALPDGLDTLVGEDGSMLSGGQRQRLAIARAFLKNAPILILDEATSALDTESERQIQSALTKLMKNKTTIVVAHRLSTVEQADTIYVLDDGVVVEQGRHQDLLEQSGAYANLYHTQANE